MLDFTVRPATSDDAAALAVLAALDSTDPPGGDALLAEHEGRVVAAVELASGRALADPFTPTADVVALLRLRREQLARAADPRGRRRLLRLRRATGAAAPVS